MIDYTFDDSKLSQQAQKMLAGLENAAPLMRIISGDLADAVEENFAQQGRPKWLGFKYTPSEKRGGTSAQLLQDSGALAASMQERSDNDTAAVGTNKVYARIHNDGGTTKPHVIKPRSANWSASLILAINSNRRKRFLS